MSNLWEKEKKMGRRMPNKIGIEVVMEFDERLEPECMTINLSGDVPGGLPLNVRYPVEAEQELDRFLMRLRRANTHYMTDEDMGDLIEAIHDTINDSGVEREDGAMVSTAEFSYYEPVKQSLRPEEQGVEQDCVAKAKEGLTAEEIAAQARVDGQEFIKDALTWIPTLGVCLETNDPEKEERADEIVQASWKDGDRNGARRKLVDLTPDPEKWAVANACTVDDAPEGLTDEEAAAYVDEFNRAMGEIAHAMRQDIEDAREPGDVIVFRDPELDPFGKPVASGPSSAPDPALVDKAMKKILPGKADAKETKKENGQERGGLGR